MSLNLKRRRFLSIVGTIGISGCISSNDDTVESQSLQGPNIEINIKSETNSSLYPSERLRISTSISNNGDEVGTVGDLIIRSKNNTLVEEHVGELDADDTFSQELSFDLDGVGDQTIFIECTGGDCDSIESMEITLMPFDLPTSVPEYTIHQKDDISYSNVSRLEYHVTTEDDLNDLSENEFMNISKDIVDSVISAEDINAVTIFFWGGPLIIGRVSAFARTDWAPNGNWEEAGSVQTGNYESHEFDFERL